MKKTFFFPVLLIVFGIFSSSCGKQEALPTTTPTEATAVIMETPTEKPVTILDHAQNLGGELWYIPNQAVEAATWPTLEAFQGNLLLSQAENSNGYGADMHTTLIDSRSGETLAETTRKMQEYQMPKALQDTVAYLDGSNQVSITFLNEKLEEVSSVTVDGPCPNCYLSPDGSTLYTLSPDTGISAVELPSGSQRAILTGVSNLYSFTACGPYVPIAYDDLTTTMRIYASLNLETGEVELSPCQDACARFIRWENTWQASDYNDASYCRIGTGEHPDYLHLENGELQLLDGGKLLGIFYTDGNLAIYEANGTCLSAASLPEDLYLNRNIAPIWSEALGGYFLLASSNASGNCRLLFWDLSGALNPGENLSMVSWDEMHHAGGGESADPSLYAWAESISNQYGVSVRIADQCTHQFPDFSYDQLNDYDILTKGLTCVEQALRCYPDGFLSQLPYGSVREIQIYVASGLKGGEYFGEDRSYYGFANEDGSVYYIVLDAQIIRESNIFHEISHIIDRRLEYDASLRDDALYSEADWMNLQPKGFEFRYDYSEIPALSQEYTGWFIDDYSQSYPTEDRARIMEYAMNENTWEYTFRDAPHLVAKLQYYSDCIRDCFDTTGWPDVTYWEKPLHIAE